MVETPGVEEGEAAPEITGVSKTTGCPHLLPKK